MLRNQATKQPNLTFSPSKCRFRDDDDDDDDTHAEEREISMHVIFVSKLLSGSKSKSKRLGRIYDSASFSSL